MTSVDINEPGLECAWARLHERAPHSHPFSWPGWYRAITSCCDEEPAYRALAMRRGDELAGLVYLTEQQPSGTVSLAGRRDLLDYFTPLSVDGASDKTARALIDYVFGSGAARLVAPHLPACCSFGEELRQAATAAGLSLESVPGEPTMVLPLPPTWDEYLGLLSPRGRHELRRKRRRLEAAHPHAQVRDSTEATLEADLDRFVRMHTSQPGEKGQFLRGWRAGFFRRLACDLLERRLLRLTWLESGGEPLAVTFGFSDGITYFLYNSSYDSAHAAVTPGLYLVSELIRQSIRDALETFDFLRGSERYKLHLGGRPIPIVDLRLSAPGPAHCRR